MFGISFDELLVIVLIAAVLIRPKDVPAIARFLARIAKWTKRTAAKFSAYIEDAAGEQDEPRETFHQQIERMRGEMRLDPRLDLYGEIKDKKTPTLNIDAKKKKNKR
ncbi:MAG: hypothetical protein LBL52_02450 [Rickettsiales bacterium]|nr:hypothetical protein [Rickettsiales bacterium]